MDDPDLVDERLIGLMMAHPKVIEQPIVVIAKKAVLRRPAEKSNPYSENICMVCFFTGRGVMV